MVEREEKPAMQIIVLGSGGGPKEDNTTAFLVRSHTADWKRGSILAVDAGVHLSAIYKILEKHFPSAKHSPAVNGEPSKLLLTSGPFAGLELKHASVGANAAYINQYLVDTYLITHPHLDHISGFVVNTAGLPASRPKRLAGLPATISAFSNHIFNNVIWPNLSDEKNGAGLVTYMRLVDGGSPAIGDGDGTGYVEICEGLSTRPMSVSHGHCLEKHSHRGSNAGAHFDSPNSPHSSTNSNSLLPSRMNISPERYQRRKSSIDEACVYDSCAYFIRDIATGREVLIFGDVEPDAISLSPRNIQVWKEAAPKIASGVLSAIFVECSYSDTQKEEQLYGHLAPRYLIEEMKVLASSVAASRYDREPRKRKRSQDVQHPGSDSAPTPRSTHNGTDVGQQSSDLLIPHPSRIQVDANSTFGPLSPVQIDLNTSMEISDSSSLSPLNSKLGELNTTVKPADTPTVPPLAGLKIVIIHVKDKFEDGPPVEERILEQLREHEAKANLGCEFILARPGMSVYV